MPDVVALYVGPEINSAAIFSKFYVTFWGIFIFSAGLPCLYLIGFLTFFIQFSVYKTLLLNYYKKTVTFDDKLPRYTVIYFKIGIVLHIIFSGMVFASEALIPLKTEGLYDIQVGKYNF
jgi:uncharacterized protein YacL